MNRLTGKTALITAAGQGIGAATARAFVAEGGRVIATDRDAETLAALKRDLPDVETHVLDVTDAHAIRACVAEIGPVNVLFNGVGWVAHGTVLDSSDEDWAASFDINVTSMFRMIRAVLPGMLDNGGGSIVNVSSMASSLCGTPARCAYGASKAAVIGLSKSVAADYIGQGVRCNVICPSVVQSPSLDQRIRERGGDFEEERQKFVARTKMGRIGQPEEIAAMAVHLAGDESGFTTGAVHIIDGGRSL